MDKDTLARAKRLLEVWHPGPRLRAGWTADEAAVLHQCLSELVLFVEETDEAGLERQLREARWLLFRLWVSRGNPYLDPVERRMFRRALAGVRS